jgi:NADH:ubiquinone reductase (H+-translocating)
MRDATPPSLCNGCPRVVIVGGGFGGLRAARELRKSPVEVVLYDHHNYHLFQPLLYQVAAAVLSPADIAQPIRKILSRQANCQVSLTSVRGVDLAARTVTHGGGTVPYDYLVLATGATHSYFAHPEWASLAPGLKTIDDAVAIRRRILLAFEEAEQDADPRGRAAKLTFVVVGAGPTGVELAGALKEIAAETIPRDFRQIDTTTTRVILLEGADRVLPSMAPASSRSAERHLRSLGVDVRTSSMVTGMTRKGVTVGEEFLPAANVLWAAGVQASPLAASLGVELDRAGRVLVNPDLSVPGHPDVFVVGDLAHALDPRGEMLPGVAPVAMQGGSHVGRLIAAEVGGRVTPADRPPFRYRDKGTMATVGRFKAVAEVGERHFDGGLAWLLWGGVHILYLVSFRAKVFVMLNWVWNIFFFNKAARLITGPLPGAAPEEAAPVSPPRPPASP